jgi:hypothetical protein
MSLGESVVELLESGASFTYVSRRLKFFQDFFKKVLSFEKFFNKKKRKIIIESVFIKKLDANSRALEIYPECSI